MPATSATAPGFATLWTERDPDGVFHLAAVTFVPKTIERPELAYEVNFLGTVELLAAVREAAPRARVVLVTTGEIYGAIDPAARSADRRSAAVATTVSVQREKAAADLAGFQTFWSQSLDVVRARPFNHTGPGQPPEFVCSEFARALVAAETGAGPATLRVGNLDVERDFSDVRDIVRGYVALFEKGTGGEAYNLGSGSATPVRTILEELAITCSYARRRRDRPSQAAGARDPDASSARSTRSQRRPLGAPQSLCAAP